MGKRLRSLLIDNGGDSLKTALSSSLNDFPTNCLKVFPNQVFKEKGRKGFLISDQLKECEDFSSLYIRAPTERGFVVNWETEKYIWERLFSRDVLNCDPTETQLILTEPCFNLRSLQQASEEIMFEEFQFNAACRVNAQFLASRNDVFNDSRPEAMCIVDSGYSFTHVVPILENKPYLPGIVRVNVGGKLLTNHLKELVSFRYYNMMDETYIMNKVKEECCFVSEDFANDLKSFRDRSIANPLVVDYLLPDFIVRKRGEIRLDRTIQKRDDEQILTLGNERISVPELLFNPSDIGMNQGGIIEAIVESINRCPKEVRGLMYANLVLVGGNSKFPGYSQRIETELRKAAPSEFEIKIYEPEDPITFAAQGGISWVESGENKNSMVTRQMYEENGFRPS